MHTISTNARKIGEHKQCTRIHVKVGQCAFSNVLSMSYPNQFASLLSIVTTSLSRLLQLEMQVKNESTRLVDENGSDVSGITYTADHLSNALVAYNVSKRTRYYWTLPKKLLGNKVNI